MNFPFELRIGLRYTRARRRNRFISFISGTAMLGMALGVAALITVLSVMNGFEQELRARILGVISHVTVTGANGQLTGWQETTQRLGQLADTGDAPWLGIAPYVQGQALLTRGGAASGVIVRGVRPDLEPRVSEIGAKMRVGTLAALEPGAFGIVLGKELAWALSASVGDSVTLIAPEGQMTPVGILPRQRRFTVAGVFDVGMYEYDSGLALIHIEDAQALYRMPDTVSGLRLRLGEMLDAGALRLQLATTLGSEYRVRDWTQEHSNFFRALRMEKTVMFVILSLIVAVAAFNMVSTLVMVVTDKRSEIAILRTLGASPASIMAVFMVQGAIIGVVGTLAGAGGGVLLALNVESVVPFLERLFDTTFLAKDVYYISELPSEMRWEDVMTVTGASLVMAFVATLYPAWRAARTEPAAALRYE